MAFDCETCVKNVRTSIDDVNTDCYQCVYHAKTIGVYPHYESMNKSAINLGDVIRRTKEQLMNTNPPGFSEDAVNSPKHYQLFPGHDIEVRDVISVLVKKMDNTTKYHFDGIDTADYFQAMQYFMRFMEKNGKEDLEKGVWYINKIIDAWDETNATYDT